MYMNVNAILAAQRPGAGLAGPPGGAPGPAPRGVRRPLRVRLPRVSVACWQGLPGRTPGLWAPVCVDCSLRLLPCPAGSCLPGTAGAGRGAHALVARSRHEPVHSAQISPHLRSLADVVLAGSAARLRSAWLT